ncbi:hypothetical protein AP065_10945 [Listeria monocytogenes]|nr:hypothetical protein AP065_10945 [Listeria monocytogenes]
MDKSATLSKNEVEFRWISMIWDVLKMLELSFETLFFELYFNLEISNINYFRVFESLLIRFFIVNYFRFYS